MNSLKRHRKHRSARAIRRRLIGAGLLTAAVAGLILIVPTGSDYTASQRETASNGINEELVISEISQPADDAPVLASLEEKPAGEVALGFSSSGTPEYVTTQPAVIQIPAPILFADNWMLSSPAGADDLDAQPTIHPQSPHWPPTAGVADGGSVRWQGAGAPWSGGGFPGGGNSGPRSPSSPIASGPTAPPSDPTPGDSGPLVAGPASTPPPTSNPQGFEAPLPGGGSPGGDNSGPRNPSSPIASGPTAPPSDPMPGDNGPLVAGPTTAPPSTPNPDPETASVPDAPASPPANNPPGPVDLPDELAGPVVGANDDPQDDWLSPGHSPGLLEIPGDFTLGSNETLLFEILGDTPGEGGYDQLIVNGNVTLDAGNVIFAFINGYAPDVSTDFQLILADSISVGSGVSFHYGFFGTDYPMHAPYDLSAYDPWDNPLTTMASGISMSVTEASSDDVRDGLLEINYGSGRQSPPAGGDDPQPFDPIDIGAEIPAPAPLLLLATGLLLAGSFRRRA